MITECLVKVEREDRWHGFPSYLEVNANKQNSKTLPEKYTKHHASYVWEKATWERLRDLDKSAYTDNYVCTTN